MQTFDEKVSEKVSEWIVAQPIWAQLAIFPLWLVGVVAMIVLSLAVIPFYPLIVLFAAMRGKLDDVIGTWDGF